MGSKDKIRTPSFKWINIPVWCKRVFYRASKSSSTAFCCRLISDDAVSYRLFWYQVLTCVSVRLRAAARSMRSCTLRYFCRSKLLSSWLSWWSVKAVRALRGFFVRIGGLSLLLEISRSPSSLVPTHIHTESIEILVVKHKRLLGNSFAYRPKFDLISFSRARKTKAKKIKYINPYELSLRSNFPQLVQKKKTCSKWCTLTRVAQRAEHQQ